ncbi:UDP-2,4-diacetamido-2,4,6-trideoxy-beta-L-altropyranose hydrolase [Gracilibacillus kekensis]|uniref:UDP-2,4-diacetamido-2,4,6-trideoxy-beta-L-altropyranose hydrolase n=1 Tax=Gracilibacillus kekensis TaxID=1027249 RepID=A0A1M7NTW9_9BACI|nr:UDP-2,4-diacetamido-2,4,6-trideoxy-beta-L-altropyranose hydrolase [Gracilibacillus kekensis]SHN07374.1 UDP-2,4-diacetamido-2,4,6-trideoxy-beta-L-altropyranose hydrolase [Gracilibacillus kekensis]
MRIVFRVDSSFQIGTGHVRRCLVLAEQLRKRGAEVIFICHNFPGNVNQLIKEKGFSLVELSYLVNQFQPELFIQKKRKQDVSSTIEIIRQYSSVDYLVVDHYGLDEKWERLVSSYVKHMIVIDDLANRKHYCNTLVDQNLLKNRKTRYKDLVPDKTKLLLGPKYLLLREEFKKQSVPINQSIRNIRNVLVSFGGTDPTNETCKTLEALLQITDYPLKINTIISTKHPELKQIQAFATNYSSIQIHTDTNRMATLMTNADLAIGAGGTTTWERCYLQLPALTIETARNQRDILHYLDSIGFICHLGESSKISTDTIKSTVQSFLDDPEEWRDIKERLKSFTACVVDEAVACYMTEGEQQ